MLWFVLTLAQKQPESATPPRKGRLNWDALLADLSFFVSLMLGRLIVWRVLRARRRERAARLKIMRVINGGGQASADGKTPPCLLIW